MQHFGDFGVSQYIVTRVYFIPDHDVHPYTCIFGHSKGHAVSACISDHCVHDKGLYVYGPASKAFLNTAIFTFLQHDTDNGSRNTFLAALHVATA